MRTRKEIKERIACGRQALKNLRVRSPLGDKAAYITTARVKALEWVLDAPEEKRDMLDYTEEEGRSEP